MKKRISLVLTFVFLTAGGVTAQRSFYNKEFKFGFKYPAGSKLSRNPHSMFANGTLKGLAQVSLTNPGRGLGGAAATVSAANMTQDACRALSVAEDQPRKKKFGTVTFDKTAWVEGGMESVHPLEVYRTFHSGVCYEVLLEMGMEKYPKRRVNESAAFNRLYVILRTFYFRS